MIYPVQLFIEQECISGQNIPILIKHEFIDKSVIFIVDIGMCIGRIAQGCKSMHKEKRSMGENLEHKTSLPFSEWEKAKTS